MSEASEQYDTFTRMDTQALKLYLQRRGMSGIGRKELLVARVFAAHEMGIDVRQTLPERQVLLESDYKNLLVSEEGPLPDPMYELNQGWLNQQEGMKYWPPTRMPLIGVYFGKHDTIVDKVSLTKRLMCDYKEVKGYSYFASEFVFEIYFHHIDDTSKYCFLKSKCTPSQRIRDIPHEIWVAIEKETGLVHTSYCTCIAGLAESCNHIAAVLFKVDFSWNVGDVEKACTSLPVTWAGKNRQVAPMKIQDLNISKPTAEKPESTRSLNCPKKRLFSPQKKEKGMTEDDFIQRLAALNPRSVTLGEREPIRNQVYVGEDGQRTIPENIPKPLTEIALECTTVEELANKLPDYSSKDIEVIEKATQQQGGIVWLNQRKGRVTASQFHRVSSHMISRDKNPDTSIEGVVSAVMGYKPPPAYLPALNHGKRTENDAAQKFKAVYIEMGHQNVTVENCGLFVSQAAPYIGASPDRLITCDCCGKGVLEIKCPYKTQHLSPTDADIPYLQMNEDTGVKSLSKPSEYYTQIQGQMALTGFNWGYFFVFTKHGHHVENIVFDKQYWSEISSNITRFFYSTLLDELVLHNVQNMISQQRVKKPAVTTTLPKPKGKSKPKGKGKQKCTKSTPVYLCGKCSFKCEEVKKDTPSTQFSVQCDFCKKWFHWGCVDFCESDNEDDDDDYMCPDCIQTAFSQT